MEKRNVHLWSKCAYKWLVFWPSPDQEPRKSCAGFAVNASIGRQFNYRASFELNIHFVASEQFADNGIGIPWNSVIIGVRRC